MTHFILKGPFDVKEGYLSTNYVGTWNRYLPKETSMSKYTLTLQKESNTNVIHGHPFVSACKKVVSLIVIIITHMIYIW